MCSEEFPKLGRKLRVLVLDGELRASLAVVRSLGRKRCIVAVAGSTRDTLAGSSRYCVERFIYRNPRRASEEFLFDLRAILEDWKPNILLPISDLTTSLVLSFEEEIRKLVILPCGTQAQFAALSNKANLADVAREIGINIPRSKTIEGSTSPSEIAGVLSEFTFPVVIKPAVSETQLEHEIIKLPVKYSVNLESAMEILKDAPKQMRYLVQEMVEGQGIGVSALCAEGKVKAVFCHCRLLEKPPSGGVSVLSESISPFDAPVEEATKLLERIGWNGVAMVEFKRRSSNGEFILLEINPRFWGSLQLAIDCGQDFPWLLLSNYRNKSDDFIPDCSGENFGQDYRIGRRLRWFWGTIDNAIISLKIKRYSFSELLLGNKLRFGEKLFKTTWEIFRPADLMPFFVESKLWFKSVLKANKSVVPSSDKDDYRVMLFIESGGVGGAEKVVISLAKLYRASGVAPYIVTCRKGWLSETAEKEGIRYQQIESNIPFDFKLVYRLLKFIRRNRIQMLHTHPVDSGVYGALAARIAGIPHLATEHGEVHHLKPKKGIKIKFGLMQILGSRFSAVSEFTRNALHKCGVSDARTRVIANPVFVDERISQLELRKKIREQTRAVLVDHNPDVWIWLQIANLRAVKDQDNLLRAFAKLQALPSAPSLLIVVGDGPERENLFALSKELGISEKVKFMGFQQDVIPFVTAADGYVLSSISEAMPISLLEAAAAGLPLVGTRVGGVPEVINEKIGFLCPPKDSNALANAMFMAMNQKRQDNQVCSSLPATFSSEKVSERFLSLFRILS